MKNNELSLEEIQRESIQILSIIDNFCESNGIQYSLGYGALIGAVRHKGFIPWDDDVDIILTRPNYEKFVGLVNNDDIIINNHLKFFAPELDNAFYSISHICDMNRTSVRKYYEWTDENVGIWIDVFPIDSLPEDEGTLLRNQSKICYDICGAYTPFSFELSFERNLKNMGKKCIYGCRSRKTEIAKYIQMIKDLPPYGSTDYVCNFGSPYGFKDIHRKELFEEYIRLPFGEITVSVIKDYHDYLEAIYGNYMQIPPVAMQVRGHSDNKYFWR